jgi:hypothetical protein
LLIEVAAIVIVSELRSNATLQAHRGIAVNRGLAVWNNRLADCRNAGLEIGSYDERRQASQRFRRRGTLGFVEMTRS